MRRKQEGVLAFFARHNRDFSKKVGCGRSRSTYLRYRIVCGHLEDYVRHRYRSEDRLLSALRPSFVDGFDTWLRKRRRLSPNTVWGYMIVLKHVLALAGSEGLMTVNPFSSYVNSYSPVDRGYLSEEDLMKFMSVRATTRIEETVRDMFLFSAFTGLSYIDIRNLREENLKQFFDGNWWIVTRRRKTRVESSVRLLEIPLRIIGKYRGRMKDGRLFPVPSNNCCNENLKRLAARCDIRTHVTFHVGRHTFATMSLNRGMPVETLSRILGHTNIRTTQIYAKITNRKISEDMARLADGLSTVERDICRRL